MSRKTLNYVAGLIRLPGFAALYGGGTATQAKWTNAILDEMLAALRRNRPGIPAEKFERLRDLMNKAAMVQFRNPAGGSGQSG